MCGSMARRHVAETLGRDDRSEGNHGIVAEMEQETCEHSTGPGTGEGKDHANESEQADKAPGPTELGCVHEPKERARHHDARRHASARRAGEFHAEELETPRCAAR